MYFVVYAKDCTDPEALERRMSVREQHVAMAKEASDNGDQVFGAALLNDAGDMYGSLMVYDFEDRETLDKWLEKEPYITANVWGDIEVVECMIPPIFDHVVKKAA